MLAQHKAEGRLTQPILGIRDGSWLDHENLRVVTEMVAAEGGLVLMERTTEDATIKVVIDGLDPEPEEEVEA